MILPSNVSEYVSPIAVQGQCRECRWFAYGPDARRAAIEHAGKRGHDTFVSVIRHALYSNTPTPDAVTP